MSKKIQTLGLVEVTSQRQADNGTVCFHDPITKCDYMSYESGYVRRKYSSKDYRGNVINTIYQLNKTRMVATEYTSYDGKLRTSERTERILEMDSDSRLDLICRATANYRKTIKSYNS
jgi:hypothetical protein